VRLSSSGRARSPSTRVLEAAGLSALALLSLEGCPGSTYVQPEMPREQVRATELSVRPLSFAFDRGSTTVDATGVMTFDGAIIGSFAESGTFSLPDGTVWARMDAEGAITVTVDDPAQAGPTSATFQTTGGRLLRPDGQVLATLDASGQLVTDAGSFAVTGISSRTTRLALFLYLVAATYAEDLPERAADEETSPSSR